MPRPHASRFTLLIICLFAALACAALLAPKGSGQTRGAQFEQQVHRSLNRFDTLRLNPAEVELGVRRTGRLTLETGAGTFELALTPHDMRSDDYRAVAVGEGGEERVTVARELGEPPLLRVVAR